MQPKPGKNDRLASVRERLRNPLQLRIIITAGVLVVGYMAIAKPLGDNMGRVLRELKDERALASLASDVEFLRAQSEMIESRLTRDDTNEWVQYVIDGTRRFPLRLVNMDTDKPKSVGPLKAIVLQVELEGEIHDLDAFLNWLEHNDRLFRVETAKIVPPRKQEDGMLMQLAILGLKE